MIEPCELTTKDGIDGWCLSGCSRFHTGPMREYALGTDEASTRWRQIWRGMATDQRDETLPELTPHLPQYDDCPHRNGIMDLTSCGCKAFFCKLHDSCSTQQRTGLKLCQECDDYPRKNKFIPGRDFETGTPHPGKCGVVIGSYGMPGVVELSIALIRKTCGDVPILIADDCTPDSMGRQRLLDMPAKWPGVSLIMNGENLGDAPGDIRAFRNGLLWARKHGINYICKLSQRFIFTGDGWLEDVCDEMRIHGYAASSQRGKHLHLLFQIRSECVFLDVKQCIESQGFMARIDPPGGKIPTSAEDWLMAGINEGKLGPVHRCRKIPVDRFEKRSGVLWHNANADDRYQEGAEDYYALAKELGIDLGPEFSGAGWHVLSARRPEILYKML